MLTIHQLKKTFGEITAVDGVDLEIRPGEIFGLLGPNGAGKTTLVSMISGVLRPDQGTITYDDVDIWSEPRTVKRRIGVVPQELAVYEDLTARDNLMFWGALQKMKGSEAKKAVREVLTRVGLENRADDLVKTYSGGMKRRLNLCMGLLHGPDYLLLDEPTVGIDPQARLAILEIVREVAEAGTTVVYTTHYMEEAQELCDRIAIIDHGSILTVGTLDALIRQSGATEVLRVTGSFSEADAARILAPIQGLNLIRTTDGSVLGGVSSGGPGLFETIRAVMGSGLVIDDLSIQKPSLQNVFIRLTGRELRD